MARRKNHLEKYLANTNKKEVHDLDKEVDDCQIDKIIKAGHAKSFASLALANTAGYDNCARCLAGSRK